MADEPKPEWRRLWDEIEGYSKFRSLYEMEEQEPFFAILIRNEELKNSKSIRELKKMAAKYADECRSVAMNEEEIKDFMKFVHESEWLQYIDQTAEEIELMLMEHCSRVGVDSIIRMTIEDYEKLLSLN